MQKSALIMGISGQDGAYLARYLLTKGYIVYGGSRNLNLSQLPNLISLGIEDKVKIERVVESDFQSIVELITKVEPDEIYNLSGQSSVGLSFQYPLETFESISVATLHLLEAIRVINKDIKFFNAGSGDCFGDTPDVAADENSRFNPTSPYAVAKAAAFWQVNNYRESYGLHACTGILYNHESALRTERFVTKKIVVAACNIALGRQEKLLLGNLKIQRDWGWAPEYVEAIWLTLQQEQADDFVIATGSTYSLEQFVVEAFTAVNLDWKEYVVSDETMLRPTDILVAKANPTKAKEILGWTSCSTMPDVVGHMIHAYQKELNLDIHTNLLN